VPESSASIERHNVVSAADMHAAVHGRLENIDLFIGVAAVADYRVAEAAEQKIKKNPSNEEHLDLRLVENPDIIASVAASAHDVVVVGFAAETQDTLNHARAKRQRKGLHAIIVNDVSDSSIGFNSPNNATTFICDHTEVSFERQSKKDMATKLLQQIAKTLGEQLTNGKPPHRS
jgi:phosphopantothenoylcysteine decarboxylase/phosphopantothenate--cysteine ligase